MMATGIEATRLHRLAGTTAEARQPMPDSRGGTETLKSSLSEAPPTSGDPGKPRKDADRDRCSRPETGKRDYSSSGTPALRRPAKKVVSAKSRDLAAQACERVKFAML